MRKQIFGYDRYGNRTTHEKYNGTTQLTLDAETHPDIDDETNRFESTEGYTFDKNGNVVVDAQGRQFTFNGDNKQTKVKDDQNNTIGDYYYDGEGKRIKKVVGDETTVFVYSSGKLIAEYSSETPPENPTTSYTVTDQLGSPRVIVDALGQVVSRRDFLPFGEEIEPDGTYRTTAKKYGQTDRVRQKFTGYQNDEETGLDFAEARMYENRHGRFTAVDPLLASGKSADPQSFNRYVYVLNNPIALFDPTGMVTEWVLKDGEMFFDSRVVNQQSATELYGEGATYYQNGSTYTTSNGQNIELGEYGFFKSNGQILTNGDRAEGALAAERAAANNQISDYSGSILSSTCFIGGAMVADDVTGAGIADDPLIPVVVGIGLTAALAAKLYAELARIQQRPAGPQGVQYSLRTTMTAEYPCYTCSTGKINLNAGDVWKYGETIQITRYTGPELTGIGVRQVNEFHGNQMEIKIAEKVKIYSYFALHGHLPPGNRIFR